MVCEDVAWEIIRVHFGPVCIEAQISKTGRQCQTYPAKNPPTISTLIIK
jgi:hypothetical protein